MRKSWVSYIYGFFNHDVALSYVDRRPYVEFICSANTCKARNGRVVRRFLDTKDKGSTGNMKRHAVTCWGEETVANSSASDIEGVRKGLAMKRDGSITAAFQAKGKGVVTYSMTALTKEEIRYEVCSMSTRILIHDLEVSKLSFGWRKIFDRLRLSKIVAFGN